MRMETLPRVTKTFMAGVIAVALLILAVTSSSAFGRAASAASPARVPRLTQAEVRQLQHLTPAEAAKINQELAKAFGKLGIRAGIGRAGAAVPGQTALASYAWSGGVRWDHVWLTASYADLAAAARSGNKYATAFELAAPACAVIDGVGAVICAEVAAGVAALASRASFVPVSNHGVWAAYYWFPYRYVTGGYW